MKIALCNDEPYEVSNFVKKILETNGHQVVSFGACLSGSEEPWVKSTHEAAQAIANKSCDEGIFFCYSGTGASMVANKVRGIRAALCADAQTAKLARTWNNANVLVMSNRIVSNDLAKEIIEAWFEPVVNAQAQDGIRQLSEIDSKI